MQSDSVSFSKYYLYSEKDSRMFGIINLSCRSMYDKLLNTIKETPASVQYWNEKIELKCLEGNISHTPVINNRVLYWVFSVQTIEQCTLF